jgi:hypothetical protein
VAHLADEAAHSYRWWQAASRAGFPTEVRELTYFACGRPAPTSTDCKTLDGGRLLTGGEAMTISARPGEGLLWITRAHAGQAARLGVYVNGQRLGARLVPEISGHWVEFATFVPAAQITGPTVQVRVEVEATEGHYMPYYHWFYQGIDLPNPAESRLRDEPPCAETAFAGTIRLVSGCPAYDPATRTATLDTYWSLAAETPLDAKVFVHLYGPDGQLIEAEGAQIDRRVGGGVLPPANWLPSGVRDTFILRVPQDLPPGVYRVAIGMYDPASGARLAVTGERVESDNRAFIGEIEVRP